MIFLEMIRNSEIRVADFLEYSTDIQTANGYSRLRLRSGEPGNWEGDGGLPVGYFRF